MKTSKKITIAALSAATALVGATGAVSSFAWFAVNSTVTADGMVIKAESTNAFLEIKSAKNANGEAVQWDEKVSNTSATYNVQAKTIKPTSLVKAFNKDAVEQYVDGGTTHAWVSATSKDVNNATKDGEYKDVTIAAQAEDDSNLYTLIADFDLRLRYTEGMTINKFQLSAQVGWAENSGTGNLADAVEIFMVVGEANKETVTVGDSTSGFVFTAKDGWDEAKVLTSEFEADPSKSGTRVRIFAFFNGEDETCTTVNATTSSEYSTKITFSVAQA